MRILQLTLAKYVGTHEWGATRLEDKNEYGPGSPIYVNPFLISSLIKVDENRTILHAADNAWTIWMSVERLLDILGEC